MSNVFLLIEMSQAIPAINIYLITIQLFLERSVIKWSYSARYHYYFLLYDMILEPLLNAHEDKCELLL